ncbi:GntR family transcriptional regulator [Savagea sp. SN6]|uniref:GntR family transcriptional regulator n=1 Tax=Savagea serpentis TaxID=2785297 RepID=A0A8J7KT58_9BACL|nr:GntR family transcriptional regulator [Savagea serpentis]MBF4501219.1 GntR family transcriptional regulator [Savagea serpentis]
MIMTKTKMNKRQYAYHVIRSRIVDGTYVAGQRIVIDQIAKEVNSSHIPVREAIHQLESEQLIEYEPNIGAIVKGINKQDYEQTLEVLAVLEGYATALSAPYMTEKAIEQLTAINLEMKHHLENYEIDEVNTKNRLFHYTIYQQCPNEPLIRSIKELWERLDIVRQNGFTFFPQRTPHSIGEHEQLLQYFREQASLAVIERAAREHKMNTLHAFRETHRP